MQATLNLADDFSIHGKELVYRYSQFPAGEQYFNVVVPDGIKTVRINTRANTSDNIMIILLAVDALRRQGVGNIELCMPYLPYARQDRVCKEGDSFSLGVICALLRALQVRIISYDVHSDVPTILLDGEAIRFHSNRKEVHAYFDSQYFRGNKEVVLVCPDAGARKKTGELYKASGRFDDILYCNKTRVGEHMIITDQIKCDMRNKIAFVVDDICDGGGTFMGLGNMLEEAGCTEAHLFVSHGVFSKGVSDLLTKYKTIGTTNSFRSIGMMPTSVRTFELEI